MLFGRLWIRQRYNLMERSWNDTFRFLALSGTHHRMSFTTSCLSIRKYRSVISFEYIVYQSKSSLFIYITLQWLWTEYTVKAEYFRRLLRSSLEEFDLIYARIHLDDIVATLITNKLPLYFYFVLIGRHLTMTFTASVIFLSQVQIYQENLKFFYYILRSKL